MLVAGAILLFGVVSRRLSGTVITPPIIFVALGLALGPAALGLLEVDMGEGGIHVLAELTLVFILFGDSARIDLRALRRELGLPIRLLGVGMPLTIGLGMVLAKLLFEELSWFEAGVLGAVLAPTDAALGQAVVSSEAVPLRIRQALNVESGLNDGIALPLVMVLAALGSAPGAGERSGLDWALFATLQVTLGPLVGVAVGWLGGKLVASADERGWMDGNFERLSGLAMALFTFGLAESVGGNGFIAAFVAGLTLGNTQRDRCEWIYEFLEAEGQLLMVLVFLFFGASLAPVAVAGADWSVLGYALLSLTVVRMLPVAVSLMGSKLRPISVAFLGWFGPRGLATVLFAILVIDEASLPHGEEIFVVALLTALLSVVAHGLTSAPGAAGYGRAVASVESCAAEHERVTEHPLRERSIGEARNRPDIE